jgi:hypothetical protein
MDQKTKEELIKLAKGSSKSFKDYNKALGFSEPEKFADAHYLKYGQGKHIPATLVYHFYYKWVKETSNKKPVTFKQFANQMGKIIKGFKFRMNKKVIYVTYKIEGFPEFTHKEFKLAKEFIREQKEKRKNKLEKKARRNKEVL